MKTTSTFITLLLVSVFLLNCDKNDDVTFDNTIAGTWKFITPDNVEIIHCTDDPSFNCDRIAVAEISFTAPDINGNGNYSGIIWANKFAGNYSLDNDNKISIHDYAPTEICEPCGSQFHSIRIAEKYEIKEASLTIFYDQNRSSIELVR